jgi:type III pantothenate kinase
MNLLIDIGNTHTHYAWSSGDEFLLQQRVHSDRRMTQDEIAFWLERSWHKVDALRQTALQKIVISSVVPVLTPVVAQAAEMIWQAAPYVVDSHLMEQLGFTAEVINPQEVGADRLVNAYAAWKQAPRAAIIVDFGTATTFDVLTDKGFYGGGVIAPGVNLSLEALQRAAAKLPNVAVKPVEQVIGKHTEAAMQSGLYYGYLGLVERIIAGIKAEMTGQSPHIIATGGLAGLFAAGTDAIDSHQPDLTIEGLRHIALDLNRLRR